jgi:hypothetical protein
MQTQEQGSQSGLCGVICRFFESRVAIQLYPTACLCMLKVTLHRKNTPINKRTKHRMRCKFKKKISPRFGRSGLIFQTSGGLLVFRVTLSHQPQYLDIDGHIIKMH